MHIRPVSDLHLQFGSTFDSKKFNPSQLWYPPALDTDKDTVLVIAGDTWESKKYLSFAGFNWLKQVSSQFKAVVKVLGNHDYYGSNLSTEYDKVSDLIKQNGLDNVHLLQNNTVLIEDVLFAGSVLWTDIQAMDPVAVNYINLGYPAKEDPRKIVAVSDFKYIRIKDYRKFNAAFWLQEHNKAKNFLINHSRKPAAVRKLVFVSHMAPSFKSLDENEQMATKDNDLLQWLANATEASNLESELAKSEIDLFVHGHIHRSNDYMIGNTRVVSNPRGYDSRQDDSKNKEFDPCLIISL